jgi:IclR family transcriptional regulator, acetate operon repressor
MRSREALQGGSVERALAILEFVDRSKRGWTMSELSRKLEMPKSTTHKLVATLERLGYLRKDSSTRSYILTLKVCGLGHGLIGPSSWRRDPCLF